jgi:hypothetical protein
VIGEVTVVGQQQQALAGEIEASDGVDLLAGAPKQLRYGRTALGVFRRGDIALGLVEHEVEPLGRLVEQLPVDPYAVVFEVRLGAKFRHDAVVDADRALGDEFFGLATGRDAGPRQDFL